MLDLHRYLAIMFLAVATTNATIRSESYTPTLVKSGTIYKPQEAAITIAEDYNSLIRGLLEASTNGAWFGFALTCSVLINFIIATEETVKSVSNNSAMIMQRTFEAMSKLDHLENTGFAIGNLAIVAMIIALTKYVIMGTKSSPAKLALIPLIPALITSGSMTIASIIALFTTKPGDSDMASHTHSNAVKEL